MIYGEYEFLGMLDVPNISTMLYIDSSLLKKMHIRITDKSIEIKTDGKLNTIFLKQIQIIDRQLPNTVSNKIINASKSGSYVVVDYKIESFIGYGSVQCSMILTGKKSEISRFKYFLKSVLGIKVDPLIGSMKPEETRLLLLLAMDMNKVNVLLPIFNDDTALLKKTFSSLKAKDLVDEYSSLTPKGHEIVAKVKGTDHKNRELGTNINSKFAGIAKYWDTHKVQNIPGKNKVVWQSEYSSMSGNILTEDIHKYIHFDEINNSEINLYNKSLLYVSLQTRDETNIFIASTDFSVILAIHKILDKNTPDINRLLLCIYIGLRERKKIRKYLYLNDAKIDHCYKILLERRLLESDLTEFTDEGLNYIRKMIFDNFYNLLNLESSDITFNKFKRYEQLKAQIAKKKIISALEKKHQGGA